ncbi:restriction endonuclease [Burkholderia gladioli]|uniref:McrC family protein n=1 Tax=Burkholderia gladioli TaxID=28095 RepID=UPI000CDAF5E1|nr:restriction endonuclease [Burkholderia gladioli]POS08902.1 restriction endonuclease [Burkholderia gladioli]
MQALRTVTAVEHMLIPVMDDVSPADENGRLIPVAVYLTSPEAEALLKINDKRPGFCQRAVGGVKLAQYCGIVRTASCVLEIVPKVDLGSHADAASRGRAALLSMLHHAERLKVSSMGSAQQGAVHAPLLEIFIREFLLCALDVAQTGLISRYVPEFGDLTVVRGRFHAQGQLRHNTARPHLLHCEYDEFTVDNPYNRIIRAALDACRHWAKLASTQRLWFELHARLTSVAQVNVKSADVRLLRYDRQTLHYRAVMQWCEWLLELASPDLRSGSSAAPALLFDMNKLFEDYVCHREELKEAESTNIVIRQGPQRALVEQGKQAFFTLKPDVTVWTKASKDAPYSLDRIIDAKWKLLDPDSDDWGVDEADVYQMLAYSKRYRCAHLELVYPQLADVNEGCIPPIFRIDGGESGSVTTIAVAMAPLM